MYEESRRTAPSKVVHLRNLPDHQVYESDILALAQPFGEVHKIMFIPAGANKSKQALVEMSTLTAAEHFVRYYQQQPALFMGRSVYVQFSTHVNLEPTKSSSSSSSRSDDYHSGDKRKRDRAPNVPSPVILCSFLDAQVSPTLDFVHQLLSDFGRVLRIIFFEKSGRHECLVEMDSRDQARYAKETLHGKFLTAIRSVVDVVYSNMTSLSINHNTPRAWDFVKETRYQDRQQPAYYEPERQERPQSAYYEPERYAPPPQQSHAYAPPISSMRPPARGYGSYEYDPYDYRPPSPPPPHSAPPPSSSYGYGMPRYDYEPQYLPPTSRGYSDQDIDLRPEPGQVLLVSNLDPEKVSDPNILYRLFGAYGNVVRVRILLNKPDTALVQFENSMFAQTARKYLDRFEFRGKKLSVSTSKYDEIAVSGSALSKGDFTKEYFNRSEHRYKMSDLETYRKNVVDPRKYLFVTGVKSASRSEIEEHFSKYGKVMHVELAENKPGICWIEMEDTDAAVEAIVNLHDSGFKTNFLRVSFSPKSDFRSYRQRKSSVDTRAFEKIEGKRSKRERADASDERQEESTSNHPEDPEDEHMKSLENVESVAETKSLDYSESVAEIARSEDSDQ